MRGSRSLRRHDVLTCLFVRRGAGEFNRASARAAIVDLSRVDGSAPRRRGRSERTLPTLNDCYAIATVGLTCVESLSEGWKGAADGANPIYEEGPNEKGLWLVRAAWLGR